MDLPSIYHKHSPRLDSLPFRVASTFSFKSCLRERVAPLKIIIELARVDGPAQNCRRLALLHYIRGGCCFCGYERRRATYLPLGSGICSFPARRTPEGLPRERRRLRPCLLAVRVTTQSPSRVIRCWLLEPFARS